jgi:hypothetical protein
MIQRLRRKIAALIAAGSLLYSPVPAMADSGPAISQAFSTTSVGPGPYILLNGQSTCSISVNNSGTGLTMVPQVTSDSPANVQAGAAQWVTASTIGAGSISTFGVYTGNIASLGITAFRYNITALSSGTVSGNEACSAAIGLAGAGGVASSVNLTQVGGASVSLGQTTMSASIPVTISSNQSALPVTGTFFQATQPVSCASGATCPVNATLQAGSAIAGKFGIDQTTPGTTNGVQVNAALPAGANVIGGVTGSGNFTVVQPTGTNLHAVLDTTSTTAVTQATGSNLHAQLDSGSTTAVTQATASSLNAAVVGIGTAGTPSGGVISIQGVGSGTAVPVSGTFFQATQPVSCSAAATCPVNASQVGTWTVTDSLPYSGTSDAQTLTTLSFLGTGSVDSAGKFSRARTAKAFDTNQTDTLSAVGICDSSVNRCMNVNIYPSQDAVSTSNVSAPANTVQLINSGGTMDRMRSAGIGNNVASTGILAGDSYGQFNTTTPALTTGNYGSLQLDASSILLATTGGSKTTAIAAATSGPTVIKASAGRLVRVLITTAGTSGTETFYDNASACSGTVIGIAQGTTAVAGNVAGTILFLENPAANGVTACGGTGSAAVTVSYY